MNEDERIVCPGMKEEDTEENSLRPKWLKDYTGQSKVKENQNTEDENWIDEVNQTIEIKRTDEYFEKEKNKDKKVKTKKKQANSAKNIPTNTENEENRDLWPDDWEDE